MNNQRVRLLAYVTGLVNQELLLQNEYLVAENHILKAHLRPGFRLTDSERITLAEIGKRLGRKALQKVAHMAKPDTLLAWYRRLIAHKFDGSKQRRSVGRPGIHTELENLVVRLACENSDWGYDRIVGALANLGHLLWTRPSATFCAVTEFHPPPSEVRQLLEGIHPPAHGRAVRN